MRSLLPLTLPLTLTLFTLSACDPPAATQAHDPHDAHDPPAATQAHDAHDAHDAETHQDAHDAGPVLHLNGTEKWAMDAHTRAAMVEIRNTLGAAQLATGSDAVVVADTVKTQLDGLITGCTMDGDAHDQLHVFLTAFMPAVEALRGADTPETKTARLADLWAMIVEYDRVFQ